jgi:hypothetical protein
MAITSEVGVMSNPLFLGNPWRPMRISLKAQRSQRSKTRRMKILSGSMLRALPR